MQHLAALIADAEANHTGLIIGIIQIVMSVVGSGATVFFTINRFVQRVEAVEKRLEQCTKETVRNTEDISAIRKDILERERAFAAWREDLMKTTVRTAGDVEWIKKNLDNGFEELGRRQTSHKLANEQQVDAIRRELQREIDANSKRLDNLDEKGR